MLLLLAALSMAFVIVWFQCKRDPLAILLTSPIENNPFGGAHCWFSVVRENANTSFKKHPFQTCKASLISSSSIVPTLARSGSKPRGCPKGVWRFGFFYGYLLPRQPGLFHLLQSPVHRSLSSTACESPVNHGR